MKKRICLLIYNLGSGGAEHVLCQWSLLLSDKYDVYMTVFDGDTKSNYEFFGELYNLNVKSDNSSFFRKVFIVLKRARALERFVKQNRIDLVLSFCNECNLVNTISRHEARKVCSIRSVSDLSANVFIKYVIKSKENRLILQTKAIKQIIIEKYGEAVEDRIVIFGNPFNSVQIKRMATEEPPEALRRLLSEKIVIVNVASIKPSKNHENLLRSFELVCDEFPEAYLLLIGADPVGKGNQIKSMASKSKYSDHIIFMGQLKNPFSVVSRATVFVLPSLAEGIPNALAEAMICGIPVIASNCPTGPAELLCDSKQKIKYNNRGYFLGSYGILVKPFRGSVEPEYVYTDENIYFANAIKDILSSEDLYTSMKLHAIQGAKRFDFNKYKTDLNCLVENMLND